MVEEHPTTVARRSPGIKGGASLVIEDFEVEMRRCKSGEKIKSMPFRVKDAFFKIQVYPNGILEEDKDLVTRYKS